MARAYSVERVAERGCYHKTRNPEERQKLRIRSIVRKQTPNQKLKSNSNQNFFIINIRQEAQAQAEPENQAQDQKIKTAKNPTTIATEYFHVRVYL